MFTMCSEQEELQIVVQAVHAIGRTACAQWPHAKTALFGSQVVALPFFVA